MFIVFPEKAFRLCSQIARVILDEISLMCFILRKTIFPNRDHFLQKAERKFCTRK